MQAVWRDAALLAAVCSAGFGGFAGSCVQLLDVSSRNYFPYSSRQSSLQQSSSRQSSLQHYWCRRRDVDLLLRGRATSASASALWLFSSLVITDDRSRLTGVNSSDTQQIALLARATEAVRELSPLLSGLVQRFDEAGYQLFLVGGSVRDAMLSRLGHDLDFTTDARPDVVQPILNDWAETVWDTGIAFGTVSAVKKGEQIELTTFRSDAYDGDSRNPVVEFGDTLKAI